jgi:hypothetical protein
MIIFVFPTSTLQAVADGSGSYPVQETGNRTVDSTTVVTGETIILYGDPIVGVGGGLKIETCEFRMNMTSEGSHGIFVEQDGTLYILNRMIANGTSYHYNIQSRTAFWFMRAQALILSNKYR